MPSIDERVVQMEFDNKQFEKGVAQSLKSLDALKKGLDLDKSASSLANLEKIANGLDLTGIAEGVEKIASKFTFMGRIGIRIMDRLSDSIVNAGERFLKFATGVDGMQAGMNKYETQTKAIQTITNATGKSVKEVEVVMDRLMKYTDETSYDFAEMSNSIGKFTAAGIDLDRAERAMEGIANEAAKSGAGKAEANRAMYNFSQALSVGKVTLMDWKSIENANMATKEFKETIIDTAVEAGTLKKAADGTIKTAKGTIVTYKNFNSTLQEGWFTSNVLINTLEKYADTSTEFGLAAFHAAQEALTFTDAIDAVKDAVSSGWMQSFKYIFGDLDEARKLWTDVANSLYDFVSIFIEARNTFLQGWHDGIDIVEKLGDGENSVSLATNKLSGYKLAVQALNNAWETFMAIVRMVVDTINEFLPDMDSMIEMAIKGTEKIRDMTLEWRKFIRWDDEVEIEEKVETVIDGVDRINGALKKGAKGDGVKALQEELNLAGYDAGNADGVYGPKTQAAVKRLQHDLGIKETGMWDAQTKKAAKAKKTFQRVDEAVKPVTKHAGEVYEIEEEYEKVQNIFKNLPKEIGKASDSKDIKALQEALNLAGYDAGNADGVYGPKTKAAVKKLQHDLGLEETGVWDSITSKKARAQRGKAFMETVKDTRKVKKTVESASPEMERIQSILRGVFAVIDIGRSGIDFLIKAGKSFIAIFNPIIDAGLDIAAVLGECFNTLDQGLKDSNFWTNALVNFKLLLAPLAQVLKDAGDAIKGFFKRNKNIKSFSDLWKALNKELKNNKTWNAIVKVVTTFGNAIKKAWPYVKAFGQSVFRIFGKLLTSAFNDIVDTIPKVIDGFTNFTDSIVNWAKDSGVLDSIVNGVKNVIGYISKVIHQLGPTISEAFGNLFKWDSNKSFVENIKDKIRNLSTILQNFGLVVKDLFKKLKQRFPIIGKIEEKLKPFIEKIKELFRVITTSVAGFFTKDTKGSSSPLESLISRLKELKPILDWFLGLGDKISSVWKSIFNFGDKKGAGDQEKDLDVVDQMMEGIENFKDRWKKVGGIALIAGGLLLGYLVKNLLPIAKNLSGGFKRIADTLFLRSGGEMEKKDTIGDTALKIAGAIGILAASIALLAIIPKKQAKKGITLLLEAMVIIVGAFALVGLVQKYAGQASDFGKQALMLAGSIGVLAIGLWLMTKVVKNTAPEDLADALLIIGAMLTTLAIIEYEIAKVDKRSGGKTGVANILQMCAGVLVLVAAVGLMTRIVKNNKPGDYWQAVAIIEVLLLSLGAIEYFISKDAKRTDVKVRGLLALSVGLLLIVRAFGKVVKMVHKYPDDEVWQAFGMIELLLASIAGIIFVIGKFGGGALGNITSAIPIVAIGLVLGLVVETFGKAIEKIKDVSVEKLITFMGGIDIALGILVAAVLAFGNAPMAALFGSLGIVAVMGALAAGIAIIGEVANSLVSKFADTLWKVGSRLEDFSSMTKDVDFDHLKKVFKIFEEDFPKMVESIIGLETKTAVSKMGSIRKLAVKLNGFNTNVEGIDIQNFKNSTSALEEVEKMVGIANRVTANDGIAEKLADIGAALALYFENIEGIDPENAGKINNEMINSAFTALADIIPEDALNDIAKYAPNGEHDLTKTALGIINIGSALRSYATSIGGLSDKKADIEAANGILDTIADLQTKLQTVTWEDIFGTLAGVEKQEIIDFGDQMEALGGSVKKYGESVKDLKYADLLKGERAIDFVYSLYDKLTDKNGNSIFDNSVFQTLFFAKLDNNNTSVLADFGANMSALGDGIQQFADKVNQGNFDQTKIDSAMSVVSSLSDIFVKLDKVDGIVQWWEGEKDLTVLTRNLAGNNSVASAIMEFHDQVKGFKYSSVKDPLDFLNRLTSIINRLDTDKLWGGDTVYERVGEAIVGLFTDIASLKNPSENGKSPLDVATETGKNIVENIADGIIRNGRIAINKMSQVVSGIGATVRSYYSAFVSAGEYLDKGLAQGIYNSRDIPKNMAIRVADYVTNAMKNRMGVASPSRVGIWIGEMFDQGIANGLLAYQGRVSDQSGEVAQSAIDSARFALQAASQTLISDTDMAPTIRPVLDLSEVQASASGIGGLFGSQTVAVGSTVLAGKISAKDRENSQYTEANNNADMSSAIGNLNDRINQLDETISNLQVVMDTGALVGQLTPGIDKNLGMKKLIARRGR